MLGIVLALCCPMLGVGFGILSLQEARKTGSRPALAYAAIALGVAVGLGFIVAGLFSNADDGPGV